MATISTLSELSGSAITDEQLLALQASLLIRINNLLTGPTDHFDFRENGDAGFEVRPSFLLEQLRRQLELVNRMIADPSSRGDLSMQLSQWDNPDL